NVRSMSSHSLCEPLSGLDDRFRSTRQVGSQAAALTQPKASSKGGLSASRGGCTSQELVARPSDGTEICIDLAGGSSSLVGSSDGTRSRRLHRTTCTGAASDALGGASI